MKDLLATYYDIHMEEKVVLDQRNGCKSGQYIYFIMSADNKEAIHMEQAALAYYLAENNYAGTAIPIPTIHGDWVANVEGKRYLVLQVTEWRGQNTAAEGKQLADFHQLGSLYRYEPQEISSYGQWKQLWINKMTVYENTIAQDAEKNPSDYYRLVMDIFPYIIGISENAIQYAQETEQEYRFDDADRGTIAFKRYRGSMAKSVIWTDDLVYDHPTRDLAEHIRDKLLQDDGHHVREVTAFLEDYQSVRPLSIFSWRLLYARLIYPIHLYDALERGLFHQDEDHQHYQEMTQLLTKQVMYEQRLGEFFANVALDHEALQIPVLHWV